MDDGMLPGGMTLEGIGKQLSEIRKELAEVRGEVGGLRGEVGGLRGEVGDLRGEVGGLNSRVDALGGEMSQVRIDLGTKFNDLDRRMRIGFEDTHRLLKFGLEAREALRETMEERFVAADRKHDEQIGLVKDVLRRVGQRVSGG